MAGRLRAHLRSRKAEGEKAPEYRAGRTAIGVVAGSSAAIAGLAIKDIEGSRELLPEPFDYFDHAGNVSPSLQCGAMAGMAATAIYLNRAKNPTVRGARRIKNAAGFLTGLALNTAAESPHVFGAYTSDPTDFAYGVAAALLGAALVHVKPADESSTPVTCHRDEVTEAVEWR